MGGKGRGALDAVSARVVIFKIYLLTRAETEAGEIDGEGGTIDGVDEERKSGEVSTFMR